MLELEVALERILSLLPQPTAENVSLDQAHGRHSFTDLVAPIDLPPFDNSSMDGYAVKASDVANASQYTPAFLRNIGRIAAGQSSELEIRSGQCVRVFTGSLLPAGADAVVMQEDTAVDPANPNQIQILDSAKPWENVRFHGEDVKVGGRILAKGQQINSTRIARLAAVGIGDVVVARRAKVGLLATGSELKHAGETLAPGQIYESNRAALKPLINHAGGILSCSEMVPDDATKTRKALEAAFDASDIVITCGGVSVGEMDFVKAAFEQLGGTLEFWKVAIKPGRPFVFGRLDSKFLFGLPGNPVSAFVTFALLVRPALLQWQGADDISLVKIRGQIAEPIANPGERRHFVRVRMTPDGSIHPAGLQASHALSSLAESNGLLDMPPRTVLAQGSAATVLQWQ